MYFISSVVHGQGGHLYSLRDLVKGLDGSGVEPVIVVVGDGKPTRVLDGLACRKYFLFVRRADETESVLEKLESIARFERPDVIHSCSNTALFHAMYLSKIYRIPHIHTHPGGTNPEFLPKIPYLITYSEENRKFFASHPKHREMEIFYLPSRVARIVPDLARTEKLKKGLKLPIGHVFLRVTRICGMYRESFLKSIALVRKLNEDGLRANLVILGINEDQSVYEELKSHESASIRVVAEDEYIHDADDLMEIADCVIGAGNSFMAAASLGKILLTSPSFTRYPVLVDSGNFDQFFAYNFRCTFPRPPGFEVDEDERYAALKELLQDECARKAYREFSLELFEKHFDVSRIGDEYQRICRRLTYRPLAGVSDYYRRLRYTLVGMNSHVADKIGSLRLNLVVFKILFRMFFLGARRTDKIVELAAAHHLETREFRMKKKTYDLVVLAQAHNEERFITRFLAEAGAVADGIVLFDDGSTDRTGELAVHEKLILKIRKGRNDGFNDLANRNLLLSFAELIPARWFIFLDVDEIIDERCRTELKKAMERTDADVIETGIVHLWGDETHVRVDLPPPSVGGVLWRPRLFRKKEQMRILSSQRYHFKLLPYQTNRVVRERIMVRHYGNIDRERRTMRYERYQREDANRISQPGYEHLITENVVLKPIEDVYNGIDL